MNGYFPRPYSVLPDANIWCSQTLHSWFGLLSAENSCWTLYWTEDIFAEAQYHRRKRFPNGNSRQIEAMRDRLRASMGTNRISSFPIDNSVTYRDEDDAHVHSAAVHASIAFVVSDNVKDFVGLYANPDDCPYELLTADEFLLLVADQTPEVIDRIIKDQHEFHVKLTRPFSLPKKLELAGCRHFAELVRHRLQYLNS